jgi:hypothetical protein
VNSASSLSSTTITGGTAANAAAVSAAANEMQAVSTAWAAVSGAGLSSNYFNGNGSLTIPVTGGNKQTVTVSPSGASSFSETAYVFNFGSGNFTSTGTITISGDGSSMVVFNYTGSSLDLENSIVLTGGITADQVLININDGGVHNLTNVLQTSGNITINADVIVTSGSATINAATLNGRAFLDGDGVTQLTTFNEVAPADAPAAEPPSLAMLCAGFVALFVGKKRHPAFKSPSPSS